MQSVLRHFWIFVRLLKLIRRIQHNGKIDRLHRRPQHAKRVFSSRPNIARLGRRSAAGERASNLLRVVLEDDDPRRRAGLLGVEDHQSAFQQSRAAGKFRRHGSLPPWAAPRLFLADAVGEPAEIALERGSMVTFNYLLLAMVRQPERDPSTPTTSISEALLAASRTA